MHPRNRRTARALAGNPRSNVAYEPVCHWCGRDVPVVIRYVEPIPEIQPVGSVGYQVCGPDCPDKPSDGKVLARFQPHWVLAG